MKKALFALSAGTFTLGMAEYVMMSILQEVASSLNITIVQAGHFISAYAVGVCVGAPLFAVLCRNTPFKKQLYIMMAFMLTGNLLTVLSPNYPITLLARFIGGMPHGAFFATGSIIAYRLAPEGKGTSAISMMVMGMTVANLAGIPLGNYIGLVLSWRWIFSINVAFTLLTTLAIYCWIPQLHPTPVKNISGIFRFLKDFRSWILFVPIVLANGGIFCWYSYISPYMTDIAYLSPENLPILMMLAGCSMCLGNYLGGKFSDRTSPWRVDFLSQILVAIALFSLSVFTGMAITAIPLMCVCCGVLFCISSPQQELFLEQAKGSEMMGGALAQVSFNLGNALGAFAGGLAINYGGGVASTGYIGSFFVFIGSLGLLLYKKTAPATPSRL